jgi:protein gp37
MVKRLQGMGLSKYSNGFEPAFHPDELSIPEKSKKPSIIFVCSMSDIFHEKFPDQYVERVFDVMKSNPQHIFQLLTKRAERMGQYIESHYSQKDKCPKNIWVGVTVESRVYAFRSIILAGIKNRLSGKVFLSCEPLLDDLTQSGIYFTKDGISGIVDFCAMDWIICGGESGPKARPMDPQWVRNLKNKCAWCAVPFFFKQWGAWGPDGIKRNKERNGCLLDGEVIQEWPEELRKFLKKEIHVQSPKGDR